MAQPFHAGDLVRVVIYSAMNNQVGENVLFFEVSPTGFVLGPTDADFATQLDSSHNAYKGILANTATYRGVTAQIFSPNIPFVAQIANFHTGVGTGGTTPLPTQVRGIITKRTVNAGRAFRGRLYAPFPPTIFSTSAGIPTAAYQTALSNMIAVYAPTGGIVLATSGGNATLFPILYNRKLKTTAFVTHYDFPLLFATQRRSGSYGRPNVAPF